MLNPLQQGQEVLRVRSALPASIVPGPFLPLLSSKERNDGHRCPLGNTPGARDRGPTAGQSAPEGGVEAVCLGCGTYVHDADVSGQTSKQIRPGTDHLLTVA